MKLRARPGSFSSYGNDGFDLVAEVVEAVTGKPYIRWLREQITGPAGAFSAGVGRRLAEGHVKVACRGDEPEYYNCFGAGAIHTTVPECAMFGSLFIDSRGVIGQAYLDETRCPQGATFLQGAYDAADYCLGWDSLYNRNRIPLGEGAVIKSGGTEQFTSYLLVGPACGLSLAISATNDGDAPWLEVLEDIGGEALKLLAKNREDGVEKQSAQASEPAGIKQSALLEVPGRYSGLAYGSTSVYRFSVQEETLYTETLQKGGAWQREEGLSGFQWDGKAFVKGEHDRITAEEYDGKVYYIRWGVAFCQKNAGYPSPGALWPNLAGACFTAEGGEDIFGRICLESINEENVLIFTTEHEEYPVVPLVCDSQNEKETCLISETTRDGIVFRLEQEGDRTWLCTGTDRYVREV